MKTNTPVQLIHSEVQTVRKGKVWSKEKIAQLISLYKQQECLWNYYLDSYKNKDKRNKAIESICHALNISKFDFGKKIHNLRNQYNSEMKKLDKRIEESGCNPNESEPKCRWEHFESLSFLRNVIEPRPGFQANYTPQAKKVKIKYDYTSEDEGEQFIARIETSNTNVIDDDVTEFFEEATNDDETVHQFEEFEDESFVATKKEEPSPPKLQEVSISFPVSAKSKNYVRRPSTVTQIKTSNSSQQKQQKDEQSSHQVFNTVIDIPSTPPATPSEFHIQPARDQWDAFGELVANEFRNLKYESSRRRLKRRFMQAMLDIGEEDENMSMNINVSS